MNKFLLFGMPVLLIGAAALEARDHGDTLVVTASNADQNQLLVYDTSNTLIQTIPTQGKGGVSQNAGGVTAGGRLVAAVNFGSKSVSIFKREDHGMHMKQLIPTGSSPVSVAFGHDHLYVLGTTEVESHRVFGSFVSPGADGVAALLHADGSAAQVGVLEDQLIIAEKSNVIETVNLLDDGAVTGGAALVQNIPANVDTPFGLVTRGNNAYVTIAHADEIALVRNGSVLTVTPSGTEHAPCWATLVGPFLYTSNSPSMSISRYAVYGQKIVQDAAVAAHVNGAPTDIDSGDGLIAVIDGSGNVTHLSIFEVDQDGNLTLKGASTINAKANGVALVEAESERGGRFGWHDEM
ncbi:MAG TPA: hypothetical protein VHA11_11615 [Bryobacteraceae bacterium]|nr:hypothetical protein [Bryobacteraceae bacterium]